MSARLEQWVADAPDAEVQRALRQLAMAASASAPNKPRMRAP
ncbi:MAG TPA: hypothetical protein VJV78_23200 [Polyangiales bacterium]|nr:hypothetical protein [Polyangiales bacterium]